MVVGETLRESRIGRGIEVEPEFALAPFEFELELGFEFELLPEELEKGSLNSDADTKVWL